METNFNFKSQICTSRSQSERLLSLGLKKETADMVHFFSSSLGRDYGVFEAEKEVEGIVKVWYKYKGEHRFHVVTDNGEKYPFRLMQEPEEEIEILSSF